MVLPASNVIKKNIPKPEPSRGELQILCLWIILFSIFFSPIKLWQLLKVKTEGCVLWKFYVRCFFSFFLILIITHHNWEPNYLNDVKYTETCKKSVLTMEEAFKTNNSPRNIAWLSRELFCTSVVFPSTLVPLFLSQYPAHIPEVFWTFLAPSRVPWLVAPVEPWAGAGWACFH